MHVISFPRENHRVFGKLIVVEQGSETRWWCTLGKHSDEHHSDPRSAVSWLRPIAMMRRKHRKHQEGAYLAYLEVLIAHCNHIEDKDDTTIQRAPSY